MNNSTSKKITLTKTQKPFLERNEMLEMYYSDIRDFEPLSQETTFRLLDEYTTASDERKLEIKNILVNHNTRLVISMARQYCTANDNINDLIQEGNIGLMNAVDEFGMDKKSSFQKYAMFHIRRQINLFKTNYSPIVQQTNRSKTDSVLNTIESNFIQREHREPSAIELFEEYNNNRQENKQVNSVSDVINVEYVYIDTLDANNGEFTDSQSYLDYSSKTCSHNSYMDEAESDYNKSKIEILMSGLTPKERAAIRLFYGLDTEFDESLSAIGTRLGCSSERARQLCEAGLKKMRKKAASISI